MVELKVFLGVVLAFLGVLIWQMAVWDPVEARRPFKEACELRGGHMIQKYRDPWCIGPKGEVLE